MARTPIVAGLVALSADTGTLGAVQTPDATNGNVLPFTPAGTPPTFGPFHVTLVITNADTVSHTCIIRGSGYTGAANGAANSGIPKPQDTVFTQSTLGDLSVAVAASTTRYVPLITTDRFVQPNGTTGGDLWLDWSASTSMSVTALIAPTNPV